MNTVSGYEMSSWEHGYGDFVITPDATTLRRAPWLPASAMVQCDLSWLDGTPVRQSPRQMLRAQVDEAQRLGFTALGGTELEFIVFGDSFQDAFDANYQGLTGSTRYNVDYSILGTSEDEPLMRDIRNAMYGAGLTVESSKGECNFGQHEIAFRYDEVLRTADNHVVFKTAAKEMAAKHGKSLTFMAKYDEREGNSCHIHMSLRGTDGAIVFADGGRHGERSRVFSSFVAGVLATLREFTLLYAPNVNSYKRYQPGIVRPDGRRVGRGQPDLRPAGRRARPRAAGGEPGAGRRRQPLPGAGRDARRAACTGSATSWSWSPPSPATPTTPTPPASRARCAPRATCSPSSELAEAAFGKDVVAHYLRAADVELEAFEAAVTDWERKRGFERF